MVKLTKRKKIFKELYGDRAELSLEEAILKLKEAPQTKFDQSVEVAIKLGLEHSSDPIRGVVTMPNGTGKKVTIAVFCKGDLVKTAEEAGADHVGSDELIKKVAGGWCDFDVAVATPDMMREMATLGKVLGPRGLMPNPKSGTVTTDVAKAIKDLQGGKIEFRMDKQSGINRAIGKLSFETKALVENVQVFMTAIIHSNQKLQKIQNIKSIALSSSMGPGFKIDRNQFRI